MTQENSSKLNLEPLEIHAASKQSGDPSNSLDVSPNLPEKNVSLGKTNRIDTLANQSPLRPKGESHAPEFPRNAQRSRLQTLP